MTKTTKTAKPSQSEFRYLVKYTEISTVEKFWSIDLLDSTHTVHYGLAGKNGRKQTREFDSIDDAKSSLDKLVQQKLKKGFVELHPHKVTLSEGSKDNWEGLYQSLCRDEGFEILRPKTSEIDRVLDDWESEFAMKLPNSYRKFIHRFGPVEFACGVVIYGPKVPRWQTMGEIPKATKVWRDPNSALADMPDDPTLPERLVCLACTSHAGDAFFWDLGDAANGKTKTRPIYVLDSCAMDVGNKLPLIADTFDDFITHVCLGDRFGVLNSEWLNNIPPQELVSAWRHKKLVFQKTKEKSNG
jgi:predicted DNA-binding WGR domain protein